MYHCIDRLEHIVDRYVVEVRLFVMVEVIRTYHAIHSRYCLILIV